MVSTLHKINEPDYDDEPWGASVETCHNLQFLAIREYLSVLWMFSNPAYWRSGDERELFVKALCAFEESLL